MYRKIKDLREDNDYSQKYIAKLLCCSRSNYAMYESGYVKITIEQLARLADIYDTSTDYLVGLTDDNSTKIEWASYSKEKLRKNIKSMRVENNLHQNFVASKILSCTQSSYSQYETGKRSVNIDVVITLSKFYKVSVDYLLGRTNVKKPYPPRKL